MFGIFKILKIIRQLKNGTFSKSAFAEEEAVDAVKGVFVLPFIGSLLFVVASFLLGWTNVLTVHSWVGKPLFFLFLIPLVVLIIVFRIAKKLIARTAQKHL
jgi:hypothetical protein